MKMDCPECYKHLYKLHIHKNNNVVDIRMGYCINCDAVYKIYVLKENIKKIGIDNVDYFLDGRKRIDKHE